MSQDEAIAQDGSPTQHSSALCQVPQVIPHKYRDITTNTVLPLTLPRRCRCTRLLPNAARGRGLWGMGLGVVAGWWLAESREATRPLLLVGPVKHNNLSTVQRLYSAVQSRFSRKHGYEMCLIFSYRSLTSKMRQPSQLSARGRGKGGGQPCRQVQDGHVGIHLGRKS